jgi:hypothetical protein
MILIAVHVGGCRFPGHADKKDKDSASLRMDSSGNRSDLTAPLPNATSNDGKSITLSQLKAKFLEASIPFEGVWVSEHYVNEVRQGKSLREAQDTETRCIVIPARTLQVTRWIYGFHEGGEDLVIVQRDSGYFMIALYDGRCVDTLKTVADGRLKMGRDYYVRVGEVDSSLSDLGVLEQLLFAGSYRRSDTRGMVLFRKDGKIEGLDSLGWFVPEIDYVGEPTSVDHIRLGRDKRGLKDYGLSFAGDTMRIYSVDCLQQSEGECALDTLGRELYTLKKLN